MKVTKKQKSHWGDAKIEITWNSSENLGYTCYTRVRTMKEAMQYAIEKRGFKYKNENNEWVQFSFRLGGK
jgi:hypothetical protein